MFDRSLFAVGLVVLGACRSPSDTPMRVHKGSDDRAHDDAPRVTQIAVPAQSAEDTYTAAYTRAKPWIEDITQRDDAAKRAAALDGVANALRASDPREIQAGLVALTQTAGVEYDRARFRELVRPHLSALDPSVRRTAFYALHEVGSEPQDVARVLNLADDPAPLVRDASAHLITMFQNGDLSGDAARTIEKLLADPTEQRATLRGIWGARVAPSLEARVLEISRGSDMDLAHDALYFALSTFRDKSAAVVDRLIEALADPDAHIRDRAMWGLGQGVAEAQQQRVADALLAHFATSNVRLSRIEALRALGKIGGAQHAAALTEFVNHRSGGPEMLEVARQAVQAIEERLKK